MPATTRMGTGFIVFCILLVIAAVGIGLCVKYLSRKHAPAFWCLAVVSALLSIALVLAEQETFLWPTVTVAFFTWLAGFLVSLKND